MTHNQHTPPLLPGCIIEPETSKPGGEGAAFIGISRHRLATDGEGVTTLAAFHGCPLQCKYCVNPECHSSEAQFPRYTPEQLYEKVKVDDLYFRATGGGVTFGGGEPCSQSEFICRFRELCGPEWKIRVETSLNVEWRHVQQLAPVVDEWIVDIKALDSDAYLNYTGTRILRALQNLRRLKDKASADNILIRIPIIPGYVAPEEALAAKAELEREGFARFDLFEYTTEKPERSGKGGKQICQTLTAIRRELARKFNLPLEQRECTHEGDCPGTCPLCEREVRQLHFWLGDGDISSAELKRLINNVDADPTLDYPDNDLILGEIDPEWPFEQEILYEGSIAGVQFHVKPGDELWDELSSDAKLVLVRDSKNQHDANAVAIALAGDYDGHPDNFDFRFILGYIPRTDNAAIAALLDQGKADQIEVEITDYERHGPIADRIQIGVYRNLDCGDLLRAETLTVDGLARVKRELAARGTVDFCWPATSLAKGQNVVLVHERRFDVEVYLMRVFAVTDETCTLTNVMGPLHVGIREFSDVDIANLSATNYLSQADSDFFRNIFDCY